MNVIYALATSPPLVHQDAYHLVGIFYYNKLVGTFWWDPSEIWSHYSLGALRIPYSPESVIEFTDTMIIEHTDTTDTRLMYKDIEKICQTEDALYIFIDSSRAFLIPYADLGSDTQKVIDFVKEKRNG